ncbi:MAG: hypothetical protein V3U78_03010 [Thiotrichaceae bacterium]
MNKSLLIGAVVLLLGSCSEHKGQDITKFTGEYRYYHGIAEFFVCKERVKYYVSEVGIGKELEEAYLEQGVAEDDDVYMKVKGYFMEEEQQMDGIDPAVLFVPVELLKVDKERGCERIIREGH